MPLPYQISEPVTPKEILLGKDLYVAKETGFYACETATEYRSRKPEDNPLYGVVSRHLETYLEMQSKRDRIVPRFVERELKAFLDCGVLANGFLRVHCDTCGKDRVVAFSCKGRSVCSSCAGRRMADTAAHLVDRVFPLVPVRQWVLSLPFALRYRLAYDSALVKDVLRIFMQVVFSSLRRRARKHSGITKSQCGAVTFVQRFGGAINLNVHFHSLVLDGVYYLDDTRLVRFHKLAPPSDTEVLQLTERIARRVVRLLERRGLGLDTTQEEADPLAEEEPLLAQLYSDSVQGRISAGLRAGHYLSIAGFEPEPLQKKEMKGRRCANVSGFSLHVNVCIPAKARHQLENLCRYVARPAVATERLLVLKDGRVSYKLRHRWRNGATHVIFEPLDLVAKLAALIPPPRFNLVRYHGILAPGARWRNCIVPLFFAESDTERACGCGESKRKVDGKKGQNGSCGHRRNYSWAELLKRVFEIDVLECPECGGRMRILCAINRPTRSGRFSIASVYRRDLLLFPLPYRKIITIKAL
jgi:hypothetical protein